MQLSTSTLRDALGAGSRDDTSAQLLTRRLVIVGDAGSGKRTLASRLVAAAAQQFPAAASDRRTDNTHSNTSLSLSPSAPLAAPTAPTCAPGVPPNPHAPRSPSPSPNPTPSAWEATRFPHGAGVAHAFVPHPAPGRAATECFCCDAPGALAAALPSVAALDTSVVLIALDVGEPARVAAQLARWRAHLTAHVAATLRAELPREDEVRRLRLAERQRQFWIAQRRRWGGGGRLLPRGEAPPLRTILVCTKTDRLGRIAPDARGAAGGSLGPTVQSALRTTGLSVLELVAEMMRREAFEAQCALVAVSSRVHTVATTSDTHPTQTDSARGEASVAGTITSAGGTDGLTSSTSAPMGGGGHAIFVHPFYKMFWAYLFQLLYDPPATLPTVPEKSVPCSEEESEHLLNDACSTWPAALLEEMEVWISSKFHPHAFLPHGLDHVELLSPFVTSTDALTLKSVFPDTHGMTVGDSSDGGVRLHESYMQEISDLLAATEAREEEGLIWDNL